MERPIRYENAIFVRRQRLRFGWAGDSWFSHGMFLQSISVSFPNGKLPR